MKISKLLNKKNFLILLMLLFGSVSLAEDKPVDIWNIDTTKTENNSAFSNEIKDEDMQRIANEWRNDETPIRFDTDEEGREISRSEVTRWEQERYVDSSIRNATTLRTIEDEKQIVVLEKELNSRKLGLVQSVIDNSYNDSYIDVGGVRLRSPTVRNMEQNEDVQNLISQYYGGRSKSNKLLRYVYSN